MIIVVIIIVLVMAIALVIVVVISLRKEKGDKETISEIADKYISNPADVLSLNQHVTVKVVQVDKARKRIGLSIKQA